jgi:dihydropyrimidine dehydrogenase (NAD+) subunit PreA
MMMMQYSLNPINLAVNVAGVQAPNPFWLASAPPTNTAYQLLKAFEAGWGGAVWKTLTNNPIVNVSSRYGAWGLGKYKLIGLNNLELISEKSVAQNCVEIAQVKAEFPHHAVIASLMFETKQEWQEAVKACEQAGVDGFELNFGCPHGMCERGMGSTVGQNPAMVEVITSWVKAVATTPVFAKLTPNVTDIIPVGMAAQAGGADAVTLINTLNSVMGVDLQTLAPQPSVGGYSSHGGYSGLAVKPIALHMVSQLAQHPAFHLPISGVGGVGTWQDAAEFLALGASSVQVATAVMHRGFSIVKPMISGLQSFLAEKQMASVSALSGASVSKLVAWEALDLNYQVKAVIDAETCIGCNLCYTVCDDAAYQAIAPAPAGSIVPVILEEACVGCNLCSHVCPVVDCITMVDKTPPHAPVLPWKNHPQNPKGV